MALPNTPEFVQLPFVHSFNHPKDVPWIYLRSVAVLVVLLGYVQLPRSQEVDGGVRPAAAAARVDGERRGNTR